MSDDPVSELILAVAAQDRAAFRQLYSAVGAKLMGVLVRILGNRAEAEDALQEVFIRIWLRAGRFDATRGRGLSWLIALARNHAIDRLRARPGDPRVLRSTPETASSRGGASGIHAPESWADPSPGPEQRLLVLGEVRRTLDCLGRLEPERAAALRGAYLEGLSYLALAARFGVPVNTMRSWLRRSLRRMRECLDA